MLAKMLSYKISSDLAFELSPYLGGASESHGRPGCHNLTPCPQTTGHCQGAHARREECCGESPAEDSRLTFVDSEQLVVLDLNFSKLINHKSGDPSKSQPSWELRSLLFLSLKEDTDFLLIDSPKMRSNLLLPSSTIPADPKIFSAKPFPADAVGFSRRFFRSVRAIALPEPPPWVVPPPARRTPSHGGLELVYNRLNSSPNGRIPISLRLVQLQKKSLARRRRLQDPSGLCPISSAVWFLIRLLEELHKSAQYVADEADQDRVFWDSTEPLVWLFLRVFSTSPNIISAVLGLTAGFVARSVEKSALETVSWAFDLETATPSSEVAGQRVAFSGSAAAAAVGDSLEIGAYWSWGDIGILDDSERVESDSRRLNHSRRRSHYESMIVREKQPNSLILSNYAQFLYQFEWDLDRAQEYFELAVMTEPVDGEAMHKYANFLWHERGDLAGAEETFLEAIEADPTDSYHQSSYANFLLLTGGDETCFPLDHGGLAGGS